ncbi:6160_t:CDS:1, partial [Gigaspora margarita]
NAHEDDNFNNKADQLACNHHIVPYLIFNSNKIYNPQYTPTSDNYPMELPIHC